jgi:DNA repair protein RadC
MTSRFDTAKDAAELFGPALAGESVEAVVALHLDPGRRMIGMDVYPSPGRGAELPVRTILEAALRYDATILILGSNHPGGDPTPTEEDCATTRDLADAARLLDIRLEDHLVYSGGEWRSFRQLGHL